MKRTPEKRRCCRDNGGKKEILNIRKRQLIFLGHMMMKEGLGNVIFTEQMKDKRDRKMNCRTYLASLTGWIVDQGFGEMAKG